MRKYFEFRPFVQEEMSLKDITFSRALAALFIK